MARVRVKEEDVIEGEEFGAGDGRKLRIVEDPEIVSAELLMNPKYLVMFLKLASGPKTARELANTPVIYESGGELVERVLPKSTAYRVIKRLREVGLVKDYGAIDFRHKYYKLTTFGREVLKSLTALLKSALKDIAVPASELVDSSLSYGVRNKLEKYAYAVESSKLMNYFTRVLRVPPRLTRTLIKLLGLEAVEVARDSYRSSSVTYYLMR